MGEGVRQVRYPSEEFQRQGLLFLPGSEMLAGGELARLFPGFAEGWRDLPPDPYFTGSKPSRYRRHAQFVYDTASGLLERQPSRGYYQSREFNPLFGGLTRYFSPSGCDHDTDAVLTTLASFAVARVFGLRGRWFVNVHLVRTVSDPDCETPPAPEGLHRDGYDYISLHLIGRTNSSGGETIILDPAGAVRRLRLDAPLDSLFMDDRQFRHDVTPISAAGRASHRDMVLMSYEPPGSR